MKKLLLLTIFFTIIFNNCVLSQMKKNVNPFGFQSNLINKRLKSNVPIIDMPRIKQSQIDSIKDNNKLEGRRFQFAYGFDVKIDVKKQSLIDSLEKGLLYRLSIRSKGAKSLNVIFGNYNLPNEAQLFLYGKDYNSVKGSFTSKNNKLTRHLAVEPVSGEKITIEYFEPYKADFSDSLIISKVSHDIYGIEDGDFGNSGNCQVDVNCPEGNSWQDEKHSVVKIIINGIGLCSGALINNTSQDGIPYILTAAHCICENDDAENSVYIFNYESPSCGAGDGSVAQSIAGADVRATSTPSDFTLLELSSTPPASYNVYYAGWDRRNNATTSGVGIHHPQGDVKKISTYNVTLTNSTCMNFNRNNGCGTFYLPNTNFWQVSWEETTNGHSVTEGGSSGSPLFNNQSRIVGQLFGAGYCNNYNCDNPNLDVGNYGKIYSSWSGANASSRLDDWLDSGNTGDQTLDGMYSCTQNEIISGSDVICSTGSPFTINNLPSGSTITWSNSSNITRNSSQGSNPCNFSATAIGTGSGWIKASITLGGSCSSNLVVQKNLQVGSYLPLDLRLRDPNTNNPVYVICYIQSTTVKATHDSGIVPDNWQWSVSGASVYYPYSNNNSLATIHPYSYNVTVKIRAHNSCGWSDWVDVSPDVMPCGNMYFTVSPNPAGSEITISPIDSSQKEINTLDETNTQKYSSVQIELYEMNGNRINHVTFGKNDSMKINISHLKKGLYILKIIAGELQETHQVIIN